MIKYGKCGGRNRGHLASAHRTTICVTNDELRPARNALTGILRAIPGLQSTNFESTEAMMQGGV